MFKTVDPEEIRRVDGGFPGQLILPGMKAFAPAATALGPVGIGALIVGGLALAACDLWCDRLVDPLSRFMLKTGMY